MNTKAFFIIFVVGLFIALSSMSYGESIDKLLKKLEEKNIFSEEEVKKLKEEIYKEEEKKEREVRVYTKQVTQNELKANLPELPSWVKNIKLKGDLRLRYQGEERDNINPANKTDRDRYRFRWRVGFDSKINDAWSAGFGLCSGSDDPRSTNQTFENTFQSPDARIDYAFAKYEPVKWLTLWGGKYPNPLWQPNDLLWDTDINPDGITVLASPHLTNDIKPWVGVSYFLLDENRNENDPNLVALQVGATFKLMKTTELKLASTYYVFNNLKDNALLDHRSRGNTTYRNLERNRDEYLYSYNALGLDAAINFYNLFNFTQRISIFAQYVNSDATNEDTGYSYGISFGSAKIQKLGDWEFRYNYRKLKADAWPDALPDSDFYGGSTNVKGHELVITLGIAKNVSLGLDYYKSKPIRKLNGLDPYNDETLIQIDLVLKW